MYISIAFGATPKIFLTSGVSGTLSGAIFDHRGPKRCKSLFRNYKQLDNSEDTCPEHPISTGIVLLVCNTYISVFDTNPNPLCENLFCLSDAPPPHLQRTCDAPVPHLWRTASEKKIIWGVGVSGILPGGDVYHSPILFTWYAFLLLKNTFQVERSTLPESFKGSAT